jgi:hypothetical protein
MSSLPDAPAVAPAAAEESEAASFASLPHALALHVFSAAELPADARARAKLVCTGFRDTLTDVSLWTRLDLSAASGVTCTVNDAALSCASGFARGGLTALNLCECDDITAAALLAVINSNAGALRELRTPRRFRLGRLYGADANTAVMNALLRAAPLLSAFHADVNCMIKQARALLRNEAPYGPLRMHAFSVAWDTPDDGTEEAVAAFSRDLAAHASLASLYLTWAPLHLSLALDAVVEAVLACRLRSCTFSECRLSPASAPALARLLSGDVLTKLTIDNGPERLLDEAAATSLGDALRANCTLTSFSLASHWLFADSAALAALLGALVAHPSMRRLHLQNFGLANTAHSTVVADMLGALVQTDAPSLTELDVNGTGGSKMSDAFARDVLLPAVRANISLRSLLLEGNGEAHQEAMALVAARTAAAEAEAR